ncbi:MAG TPA: HAD-IIIC family phosphatase [Candidatus Binataceae bacterium]|nr:HAD-IIIC family phosphatase [Candidatus Binataceae bacterium]
MFELDQYEPSLRRGPALQPRTSYQPARDIGAMALLGWAEHCVECAAPQCYASCDLYQPRPDRRCRRFKYGALKNPAFPCLRGYGVEVSFKKWGKLEALGTSVLRPATAVMRWERMIERGTPLSNRLARLLYRWSGDWRHAQLTYTAVSKLLRQLDRHQRGNMPDAFLLEVYNPGEQPVALQIVFRILPGGTAASSASCAPIIRTCTLPPGYSRHEIDAAQLRPLLEGALPFLISLQPEGDEEAQLVFLSADLVRWNTPRPGAGGAIKCVVWDLDNTMWEGILVEGDQVCLRAGMRELLEELDRRGILHSIASKNDHAAAVKQLTELGVVDYFLYPQIDWQPKSLKLKAIAEALNLGLDSFAFIDDNPFELAEVARALPTVLVLGADRIATLLSDPRFAGSTTAEARQRRRLYQQQIEREQDLQAFGGDYLGFLASCAMVLELSTYHPDDAQRVAELAQRTNQLNFSGHKYSREELAQVLADERLDKYVLRCSDRYGGYGTVGFCVVRSVTQLEVIDFMLSCRVQGRMVEQAFFGHLLTHHNASGATCLRLNFRATQRNQAARAVLQALGANVSETGLAVLTVALDRLRCEFVSVRCAACAQPPTA